MLNPKSNKTAISSAQMKLSSVVTQLMELIVVMLFLSLHVVFILQRRDPSHHFLAALCFLLLAIAKRFFSSSSPVYLLDFSCLRPPNSCRVPFATFLEHAHMLEFLDKESVTFMYKLLTNSGQGEQTYLPPGIHYIPPKSNQQEAIQEVHMGLFPVLEDLLSKTKISPSEIDILIVNCSGFCPVPSLSSIIVNKFSMKPDIKSFTISGMGCSASALAIDMAQNILKTQKNSNAVILSTEILSTGWYQGREHSKLLLNCIFRMGAAAVLLSNKIQAKKQAKYKLLHTFRTQRAFDDKAYYSAIREEDSNGHTGVTVRPNSLQAIAEAIRGNAAIVGTNILPYTEIIRYIFSIMMKRYLDRSSEIYVPNFKRVVQHYCLPTSARAWIVEIKKGLKLDEKDVEPALMTLHRFGNQSSSSLWYELGYMEAKERVKKGEKVWHLGVGTGPKCTSLIWECMRPITGEAKTGPWADSIHNYPISMQMNPS